MGKYLFEHADNAAYRADVKAFRELLDRDFGSENADTSAYIEALSCGIRSTYLRYLVVDSRLAKELKK